jgi:hypothetical protein
MPVAPFLVEIARRLPAHRGLHRRIDVAGREPIPRGCLAIDVDPQRRLAEGREHREIGHATHCAHHVFDLLRHCYNLTKVRDRCREGSERNPLSSE